MYPLLTSLWKKAAHRYHKVLNVYHSILYRDCLDFQMKEQLYTKMKYHEQRMNESSGY